MDPLRQPNHTPDLKTKKSEMCGTEELLQLRQPEVDREACKIQRLYADGFTCASTRSPLGSNRTSLMLKLFHFASCFLTLPQHHWNRKDERNNGTNESKSGIAFIRTAWGLWNAT